MDVSAELYKIPFLIGVVGHRDLVPEQVPAIRAAVTRLLRELTAAFADVRPTLLSSLADGADLLAADVALELNIPITAVLALPLEVSRGELQSEESRAVFDRVYAQSERLDPPAEPGTYDAASRDQKFQRAGALIARYSTLLIVIWDGKNTDHRAGTARVVEYRRDGIMPTADDEPLPSNVLLSARDNDLMFEIRCSRLESAGNGAPPPDIEVRGFVGSGVRDSREVPKSLTTILERVAEFNRDVETYRDRIESSGRRLSLPTPYPVPERLTYLDHLFRGADWLGSYYRSWFTRALRARYALWALMAFLLLSFKKDSFGWAGLGAISGVLLVFGLGLGLALWAHRRSWHRKYLDYRALAEGLRVDFYWEIAGVRHRYDAEFAHESFLQRQDIELEWIRTAMRAVSLRLAVHGGGTLAGGFSNAYAGWIGDDDLVNGSGQMLYYRQRIASLEHNLHRAETIEHVLLFAGLGLAVVFAAEVGLEALGSQIFSTGVRGVLLWVLASLTVCAVIFDSYVSEKSDRALIRQYHYMYTLFGIAARELRSARSEAQKLEILRSLGHACLAEHAQWILAHRDKRIEGLKW
jgi:hypothetical protein